MDIGLETVPNFRLSAIASRYNVAERNFSSLELRACLYIYDTNHAKSYFEVLSRDQEPRLNRHWIPSLFGIAQTSTKRVLFTSERGQIQITNQIDLISMPGCLRILRISIKCSMSA